jgi:uncharacterized protein (DUF697 family)
MVTQSRKTILKNPLDEIFTRVKPADTAKKVAKTPTAAKASKVAKAPTTAKASKVAKAPTAAKVPTTAKVPNAGKASTAAKASKVAKTPTAAKASEVEQASNAAKTSKVEKVVRPRKKNVVSAIEVHATEPSQAPSATQKTVAATESAQNAQPQSNPAKTTPAKPKVVKAAEPLHVAKDAKAAEPLHEAKGARAAEPIHEAMDAKAASTQTAEQLMAAEIARSEVPTSNREEEIVSHPCTPIKVLEQPGSLSSPTVGGGALPGSYLTAEDVFQNELSRARVSLKAEATETKLAAQKIVARWSRWSVAVSFIPTPFVDMAAISGVQVKMIYDLCQLYKVDFEHKAAMAIASGVAGGAATQTLAGVLAKQMVRFAPGIGPVFMFAIEPAISYVTSQAIGTAFISHFEADGRMHDFQPERVRQYIAAQIEKRRSRSKDKTVQAQA